MPHPLSQRELACLQHSACGRTSRETAALLGLSERTVNFHLHNACAKLKVRGRRAAVAQAAWRGLLKAPCAAAADAGTPAPAPRENVRTGP
ncbi:helix-turn-helix transcriptional regulator [Orrella sp. JC864]